MAVDLDSGTGLFDRLGRIGYLIDLINDRFGGSSADDFPTEFNDVLEKYDSASNIIRAAVGNLHDEFTSFQLVPATFLAALREAAENTLIEMVHADNPLPAKTVERALEELIEQMEDNSESVDGSTTSVSITADAGNDGDAELIVSLKSPEGKTRENVYNEDLVLVIDSTDTAGSESGTMDGELQESEDLLDYSFPTGSGSTATISMQDPDADGFLTNGNFDAFTSNSPDSWDVDTGSAGTEILEETSTVYRGTAALEYVGDASTLTQISQDLSGDLESLVPYPVSVRIKVDVVPAAGTLVIDLYDGTSVINDEEGTANSLSIDLTSATTSFVAHTADFRLPDPLPTTIKIRVRLSAALSSGSSAFIDDLILGNAMVEMYDGGPYVSLIRGASDVGIGDKWTAAITNNREGEFQTLFHRLFRLPEQQLPSDTGGTETVADSLIG